MSQLMICPLRILTSLFRGDLPPPADVAAAASPFGGPQPAGRPARAERAAGAGLSWLVFQGTKGRY